MRGNPLLEIPRSERDRTPSGKNFHMASGDPRADASTMAQLS